MGGDKRDGSSDSELTKHLPSSDPEPTRTAHSLATVVIDENRAEEDDKATETIRTNIGDYQIEGIIGRGGMGVVYRGSDPDGRVAAVKVLTVRANAQIKERFKREATIRINHPNVVRVLRAGEEEGTLFIAFELLEGESLSARFKRGGVTAEEVVDIGLQVCRGLEAAHAAGVVHRDLKPANIFRCSDGVIKILDFGVAHLNESELELTTSGIVLGTPSYLSPEQARGLPEIDQTADLWALGTVLFEAFNGRPPFRRESALATMFAIVTEPAPLLSSCAENIPKDLDELIARALQKRTISRWQSAKEFGQALADANLKELVPVRETTIVTEGRPPPEKRIVAVMLAEGVRDAKTVERAVKEHGGRLIRLLGRRSIGLFGGETWEGDEVKRAASAALLARHAADRVAVSSGRALVSETGVAGAALRGAETACAAGLSGIAVDFEAARTLAVRFPVREVRTGLHELTGFEFTTGHSMSMKRLRMVFGREPELTQVELTLRTITEERRAQGMLVTGPPGIGKTLMREEAERLVEEAAEREGEVAYLLLGRAESHRRESALALLASAIRGFAKDRALMSSGPSLDAGAPIEEQREAVFDFARHAFEEEEDVQECAPFLGELFGIRMPDNVTLRAARSNPALLADRLRLVLIELIAALVEKGVVGLMLEDLQWADVESVELITELLERLGDEALLIFMTARPDFLEAQPDLVANRDITTIKLRGLSAVEVGKLAAATAGRRVPEGLVKEIAERTSGNPMFVEQIVLELVDKERLDDQIENLPLPMSVEAAVQSRLDYLPMEEKELCKRAAIFGRPFQSEELSILGVSAPEPLLKSLRRRDLIGARGGSRRKVREYRFRSTLVAGVAYRMLTKEVRRELHLKTAIYLLAKKALSEEIAVHFERCGQEDRAAKRYAKAALGASRKGDLNTVLRCSEKALSGRVSSVAETAMRMIRVDAFQGLGRMSEMGSELAIALETSSTMAEKASVLAEQSWWMLRTGKSHDAFDVAEEAVKKARASGNEVVLVRSLGRLLSAQIRLGAFAEAEEALREAITIAADQRSVQTRYRIAEWTAQLATAKGDLGARHLAFLAAIALYKEAGDVRRAAGCGVNVADGYNRVGDYQAAESALEEALIDCRRVGHRLMEGYAGANRAYALTMVGRTEEALAALEAVEVIAKSTGEARLSLYAALYRARAQVTTKATAQEAIIRAEQTAEEAERVGLRPVCVSAWTIAARACLLLGDAERALSFSERALELRDALKTVEEDEAEVFVTHARALMACGRNGEEILSRGRARLMEIANGIEDQEWREKFLEGVTSHRMLLELSSA